MKKIKSVVAGILCLVAVFALTGCLNINLNKNSMTASEFKTKMENKGYTIKDATSQFYQYSYVKQVYLAIDPNMTYQIEFYELATNDDAVSFYNTNKTIFEGKKGAGSLETTIDLGNYSKYTVTTDETYNVISRINNTAGYISVSKDLKDRINSELKDLGY